MRRTSSMVRSWFCLCTCSWVPAQSINSPWYVAGTSRTTCGGGTGRSGKTDRSVQVLLFMRSPAALQLEVETVGEQVYPAIKQAACTLHLARKDSLPDITGTPAGQGDQAICLTFQPGLVNCGTTSVLTFRVTA